MMKSDSPSSVKYIKTMVECLTLLGKSATRGAIISHGGFQATCGPSCKASEIKQHWDVSSTEAEERNQRELTRCGMGITSGQGAD
ncbi:unnamed protein product [Sphagnum troendelagicum]|uniref:Uncharacterized protein n=1 Tax=Sphagnum troendelagicum TaxID=128251 RepID=A0ABP0UAG1_9BRYO